MAETYTPTSGMKAAARRALSGKKMARQQVQELL
jgi:hypothetical protein